MNIANELDAYWAQQLTQHALLFEEYETMLRENKLAPVADQQRFGRDNKYCLSLNEMEENGWQTDADQDAFHSDVLPAPDNSLNSRLVAALMATSTAKQMEAAFNLMLGQANNADYCNLQGLRRKFKNMSWDKIVTFLLETE